MEAATAALADAEAESVADADAESVADADAAAESVAEAEALSVAEAVAAALSVADAEADTEGSSGRRGWLSCQPSMVIAPFAEVPVATLRVPGESTTVLSDSARMVPFSVTLTIVADRMAVERRLANVGFCPIHATYMAART